MPSRVWSPRSSTGTAASTSWSTTPAARRTYWPPRPLEIPPEDRRAQSTWHAACLAGSERGHAKSAEWRFDRVDLERQCRTPIPGTAAYSAAKAGVENLTTTLAVEWAPKVRVSAGGRDGGNRAGRTVLRRRRITSRRRGDRAAGAVGQTRRHRLGGSVSGLRCGRIHQQEPRWRCMAAASRLPTCPPRVPTSKETVQWDCSTVGSSLSRAPVAVSDAHALAFAAEGPAWWSTTSAWAWTARRPVAGSAAQSVVDEITAAGGEAVTSGANVADWEQAAGLIQTAVDSFGGLDVLVNNAGNRPRPDVRQHLRRRVRRRHRRAPQGVTSRP